MKEREEIEERERDLKGREVREVIAVADVCCEKDLSLVWRFPQMRI